MSATNALSYNEYVTQLANLAVTQVQTTAGVVEGVDAAFTLLIPQALNYSELRIQRDCNLLPLQTENTAYTLTSSNNILRVSTDDFVTMQTVMVNGAPLLPVSKEFLQNVYGTANPLAQPTYMAMRGGDAATAGKTWIEVIVGPWPDAAYPVTIIGTTRMPSLYKSATTPLAATGTTWISTWLPDLLLMASMIVVSGFQRNFSATSDEPSMPANYEKQYQALLAGAATEEARKRFEASAWSSMAAPIAATPGR